MDKPERKHDAAPVELAAGWLAICATCGWVGETYGSERQAVADSDRHIAEPEAGPAPRLAFHGDRATR